MNVFVVIVVVCYVGVLFVQVVVLFVLFCNVKCCMEVCGSVDGVIVYDDFVYYLIVIDIMIVGFCVCIGCQNVCIFVVFELCLNMMKFGVMKL